LGKAAKRKSVTRTGFLMAGFVLMYWFQDSTINALGMGSDTAITYLSVLVILLGFLGNILKSTFEFQKRRHHQNLKGSSVN
jgi:hypothetical protein